MKILVFLLSLVCSSVTMAGDDPFETVNRKVHNFNQVIDSKVVKPIGKAYKKSMPGFLRISVGKFFGNLADIGDVINNAFQGKPGLAMSDLARVLVNTSIGLGGLMDVATRMGLVDHDEDFSQTLHFWGVPRGPYLVVPGMGPNDVRGFFSGLINRRLNPLTYCNPVSHRNSLAFASLVSLRANLLRVDDVAFGDNYIFYRDAYLQRRVFLENDGTPGDIFGDEF